MSVQFGKCNFDGRPVDPKDLDRVRPVLAPYGPDSEGYICKDNFGLVYRAFRTTKESKLERQPHVSASGAFITWDGRLDNREELIGLLAVELSTTSTDLSIVAEAYDQWGTDAFARMIGDWAVSIWDPAKRSLILAKDFIGTRHLYYSIESEGVTWSTILNPLILFADRSFALEEEYVAGWLSFFPAPHLTPYVGIHSVPPSSFVLLKPGEKYVTKYWDFDPGKRIRYDADAEYEEHFRSVFAEAVCRRIRSDSPVLAELSGGMDSSSIVCVADSLVSRGMAEVPRLDTVSYYDNAEPNWNETPYFSKVEQKRGRTGCHIDVGDGQSFRFAFDHYDFSATPGSLRGSNEAVNQFEACLTSQANRVVLSGIGGDEVTGGVPTSSPELQDLLAQRRIGTLARQLKAWALDKRKPWFHLFFEAVCGFLPPRLVGTPKPLHPAPWLNSDFVSRNRLALHGYNTRLKIFGPLPSFQASVSTLEGLRRQLACSSLSSSPPYEMRYPYLDRDLLEFLYAVPREQLVRPGQRRSLMRRALVGIVPDELLNRRRKAFVARSPMTVISKDWAILIGMNGDMVTHALEIVDAHRFRKAIDQVQHCQEVAIVTLMRTLGVELWLRGLKGKAMGTRPLSTTADRSSVANGQPVLANVAPPCS
jgi:asparagine synthase (glutamine-hydrolysing)